MQQNRRLFARKKWRKCDSNRFQRAGAPQRQRRNHLSALMNDLSDAANFIPDNRFAENERSRAISARKVHFTRDAALNVVLISPA
jgi:hypothetical protein